MKPVRETMSFDLRQRCRMTAELIEAVRTKKPLRILDAGSGEGYLGDFLAGDRIVSLDIKFFPGESFVAADLLRLPFGPETFDIVVSLDVLEHIAPARRRELFDELDRVCRGHLIIGAPFHDEAVLEAERLANDFYLRAVGRENDFISEHLRLGLPRLEEAATWVEEKNYRSVILPNNYLPFWMVMMGLSAYISSLPRPLELMTAVTELYDRVLARYDRSYPAYRRILLIAKSGRLDEEEFRKRFTSPPLSGDFQKRSWDFAGKVLRELAENRERVVSDLKDENEHLRRENARLREERAVRERDYRAARTELDGIKNTPAYRLYKLTWARMRDLLK